MGTLKECFRATIRACALGLHSRNAGPAPRPTAGHVLPTKDRLNGISSALLAFTAVFGKMHVESVKVVFMVFHLINFISRHGSKSCALDDASRRILNILNVFLAPIDSFLLPFAHVFPTGNLPHLCFLEEGDASPPLWCSSPSRATVLRFFFFVFGSRRGYGRGGDSVIELVGSHDVCVASS